jgi:hypothetical protein
LALRRSWNIGLLNITHARISDPPLATCWRKRFNCCSSQIALFFMKKKIREVPVGSAAL